jgi:hypothetical protein
MKTQILLFIFLCMFACSLQAQVQQRKATFPSGIEQVGSWINPPQPGFKPDHMVVPAKWNMFDSSGYVWKWDTILCFDTVHGEPSQRLSRKFNFSGDSIIQLTERRQGNLLWEIFTRETFLYDSSGEYAYLPFGEMDKQWLGKYLKTGICLYFEWRSVGEEIFDVAV